MKKILLLVVAVLFVTASIAENVNENTAKRVARAFAVQRDRNASQMALDVVYSHPMPERRDAAFYVVNLGDTGFVIVAANDVAHPVLGYSFERPWPTEGNLPPQVTDYLDDLANQIEYATAQTPDRGIKTEWQELLAINPNNPPQQKGDRNEVGPLLTTTWDQGQYYNAMCPEDANGPDGHVYTGCVATAMAQIINYHQYPVIGRGTHGYESNYGTLTMNYETETYDYTNMPNALSSQSTEAQVNAVAQLIRDCGIAVNMGYTSYESSAYDQEARTALINFFKYSPDMSFAEKAFFSVNEWDEMLKTELDANRPVFYSGRGTGGHAFVCDGYNSDGYYHFNFGWSGSGNTWYLLDAVNPLGMNFNSNQSAILGITPDPNGNVILGQMQGTSTFIVDEPLEFYHLMGHNEFVGGNYANPCNSITTFISSDTNVQLALYACKFESQLINVYDGTSLVSLLQSYNGNDNSMALSTQKALTLEYNGNMSYDGFTLLITPDDGCRMVSNITSSIDLTTVNLTWTENGYATQWQVEYGIKDFAHGEGTIIIVDNTTTSIDFADALTYYDIYIRPCCGEETYGLWAKTVVFTDAPYWQDIVVYQPNSYVVDEVNNCAMISCAEDFVWYIKNPSGRSAKFLNDINMNGNKWKPVEDYVTYNIDGNGHTINNLFIDEDSDFTALFKILYSSSEIKNIGIENSYVNGGYSLTAGLCGDLYGNIVNCYVSNTTIIGETGVGGLVARNFGVIMNSFSNVDVKATCDAGLLTSYSSGIINNCYAFGKFVTGATCYSGGIVSQAANGTINNCYSIETFRGVIGYKGEAIISDTSSFYRNGNNWTLNTPIEFEGYIEAESNLLNAMNKGVEELNDDRLRTWIIDEDTYLPKLNGYYVVNCPNITNLTINNSINNNEYRVVLDWQEMGSAEKWDIRYQRINAPDEPAIIVSVDTNSCILNGLSLGHEYAFSVRSVCDESNDVHSGWVTKNEMIDLPFWTDIVTTCPEGYVEDDSGNVTISSAEGLAWLAVLVNGFHGNVARTFEGKTITLASDIDLDGYRWFPIGRGRYANPQYDTHFNGVFQGNSHIISNMYVNSNGPHLGLFGYVGYGSTKTAFYDIALTNGSVNCYYNDNSDGGFGGLIGTGVEIKEITNCSSTINVTAIHTVGSLCGWCSDENGESTIISNCFATGDVYARHDCGGLIGQARGVIVQNNYATGNVYLLEGNTNIYDRGGLIGVLMSNAVVRNCYSTGLVEFDINNGYVGRVIGSPYYNSYTQYVYGLITNGLPLTGYTADVVIDISSFFNENGQQILDTPITINGSVYENLLEVLNAWVVKVNDPMLKTWVADDLNENGGFPVFGVNYEPSCYNPTNVTVTNATVMGDETIRTQIAWDQEGDPSSWEILYVAAQQSVDQGTIIPVTSNPCVLTNLPVGEVLDIYVRAICNTEERSGWSQYARYIPDKLRWTEVVTSQPDGYYKDNDGNVYISSAEGMAWLSSVVNELNGNQGSTSITNIYLTSDIDLSAYRWTVMKTMTGFVFEGNGHSINGLYCNEYANHQGLFEDINDCTIRNLRITNSTIYGLVGNGTIAGEAGGLIENCIVNGEISGVMWTGGLVGRSNGRILNVFNSAYIGEASSRLDITLPNYYNGYVGGITGEQFDATIMNSYVAAEIPVSAYSGIVAGSGSGTFSNIYAKSYPTSLHLTWDDLETNSSIFTGSGTTWTLNNPPYINGAFRTDLVDALNAWVDANNTNGEYLHWVADTENVNGGFPVFEKPSYQITATADPAEGGYILGAGTFEQGAICNLTAQANNNTYSFLNWTENGEAVSYDNPYSFTVNGNRDLVANFVEKHFVTNYNQFPDNMSATSVVYIDGVEQTSPLLELGAFCGNEARGSVIPTHVDIEELSINSWMYFMVMPGEAGDNLTFKLYDHATQQELDVQCLTELEWDEEAGYDYGLFNPLEIYFTSNPAPTTQITPLTTGWNWYSTYIEQNGINGLAQLESSINEYGTTIKTNGGFVMKRSNGWLGSLAALDNAKGYKVNVTAPSEAQMQGYVADPADHPITIKQNWNWIGYPVSIQQTVATALAGFTPTSGDILKRQSGFVTFRNGQWMPSGFVMTPGQMYLYYSKSAENKTLVFANSRETLEEIQNADLYWNANITSSPNNICVMAVVNIDGVEQRDENIELGAFVNGECRGNGKLYYVNDLDRYIAFLTVTGEDGDVISFSMVNNRGEVSNNSDTRIMFQDDAIIGDFENPFEVNFNKFDNNSMSLYPNPVDRNAEITLSIPDNEKIAELIITNAFGAEVMRQTNASGNVIKGLSASGVYNVQIITVEGNIYHGKVIVR